MNLRVNNLRIDFHRPDGIEVQEYVNRDTGEPFYTIESWCGTTDEHICIYIDQEQLTKLRKMIEDIGAKRQCRAS